MTLQGESIQIDAKKRIAGNKAYQSDERGSLQTQPLNEDWIELNAGDFSYTSATRIATSEDYTDKFQIGDRLRYVQTTTKYAYITAVTSAYIDVQSGDDYDVANAAITEIHFSRIVAPSGFPSAFNYEPTLTGNGTMTVTYSNPTSGRTLSFIMIGATIKVWGDLSYTIGGVASTLLYVTLPFDLREFGSDRTTNHALIGITTVASWPVGRLSIGGLEDRMIATHLNYANWASGGVDIDGFYLY